jgi:hypothetical protein
MATTAPAVFTFLFNHPRWWSVKCHAPMNKGLQYRNKAFGSEWVNKGIACRTRLCSTLRIKPWQSLCVFSIVQRATNMHYQVAKMNHDWCATKWPEWTMTDWCTTKGPEWTSTLTSAPWRMDGKWSWNRSLQTNHGSVPYLTMVISSVVFFSCSLLTNPLVGVSVQLPKPSVKWKIYAPYSGGKLSYTK